MNQSGERWKLDGRRMYEVSKVHNPIIAEFDLSLV